MGQMKKIWASIVDNNGVEELDTLIKKAIRLKADRVKFLDRVYSLEDAKQILIFMTNEEREIRRREQSIKRGPESDN
jgi:hypothetical protein